MSTSDATPDRQILAPHRHSRPEILTVLAAYANDPDRVSQRQFARQHGVARTTLQHWLTRKAAIDASPAVIAFFESEDGLAWLHRLVAALHTVFTQVGPCGVRLVSLFLRLTRLDRFVASSLGAQHAVSRQVEQATREFGHQERSRLAARMPAKPITVAQDETFHPQVCLVAIEPVSDFILLEQYSERRDAATWTEAMAEAVADLPVQIVQATSDEAKGLLSHARDGLGATHSPDLFHIQHEIGKGTQPALRARAREAEASRAQAEAARESVCQARATYDDPVTKRRGRRPAFEKRIAEAEQTLSKAVEQERAAAARPERMKEAMLGLSSDYHPWDLTTGLARSSQQLSAAIDERFLEMDAIAVEAQLSQKATAHLDKAWRVVEAMIATQEFVHVRVRARIKELKLGPELERAALERLVPARYLQRAGTKAARAETRGEIRLVADRLEADWGQVVRAASISDPQRALIERVARECADLFQRSSSCVEGRNGQLALRHHSLHRLSAGKLQALTIVHNYFLTRPDGTTAAERFFEAKPQDLFAWILDHIDVPARPAKPRANPPGLAA
jgi:lambda repressor-like predicted transcriptional regulator